MSVLLVPLVRTVATAATPLALAGLGEMVAERSGVLNLGVEGMMLVGAVAGFAATLATGSHALGLLAGAGAGMALASVFALLTLGLASNQVATGLALTIFGSGLSSLVGRHLTGRTVAPLPALAGADALVWASLVAAAVLAWAVGRTRTGMVLRAVGENAEAAHRLGLPVVRVRLLAVLFGGAMAGLGGCSLSIGSTPLWADGMVAGRGWIALALVVFGAWRPLRVLGGAWLFGGIAVVQLYGQGLVHLPAPLLATVPYLATIAVLAMMSSGRGRMRLAAPAGLARPFRTAG